jgi:hypothetical protein
MAGMTEDYIDDWGEDLHDYTFHLLMCELEQAEEKIRMWEAEKENNNFKID